MCVCVLYSIIIQSAYLSSYTQSIQQQPLTAEKPNDGSFYTLGGRLDMIYTQSIIERVISSATHANQYWPRLHADPHRLLLIIQLLPYSVQTWHTRLLRGRPNGPHYRSCSSVRPSVCLVPAPNSITKRGLSTDDQSQKCCLIAGWTAA